MPATQLDWEDLLAYLEAGSVVPIIGQDLLLVDAGQERVPLYQDLARRLSEKFGITPPRTRLNDVALERGSPNAIHTQLSELLKNSHYSCPEPLRQLARVDAFKLFVTVTFDSLLARAINEVRFGGRDETVVCVNGGEFPDDLPCPLGKLTKPVVYHLFGRRSPAPGAYAATDENFLEFILRLQSSKPDLLFDELRRNHLLVLGCSFPDWLARFFLRTLRDRPLSETRTNQSFEFIADEYIRRPTEDSSNLVMFLERSSHSTRLFKEKGVAEFVDNLSKLWQQRSPEEKIARPPARPDDERGDTRTETIFLSYCRRDVEQVRRIRDALIRHKLSVWMDERDLEPGEAFEEEIIRKIQTCHFFMPVISENALGKGESFFWREWRAAIDRSLSLAIGRRLILPVIIDNVVSEDTRIPREFRSLNMVRAFGGDFPNTSGEHLATEFRRSQKPLSAR